MQLVADTLFNMLLHEAKLSVKFKVASLNGSMLLNLKSRLRQSIIYMLLNHVLDTAVFASPVYRIFAARCHA